MTSTKKKMPTIGTIFSSSDSSSDELKLPAKRRANEDHCRPKTDASGSDRPSRITSLKVNLTSADGTGPRLLRVNGGPVEQITVPGDYDAPEGYRRLEKTRIGTVATNTFVQYETIAGKVVKPKYFKKVDSIAGTVIVGFYRHNKRNYSESLSKIKSFYVKRAGGIDGGADGLRDTIELQRDQWNTLRRDMIISYEKDGGEFVYKAKFNSFTKAADGSTRMSLTTDRGFSYTASPEKMIKLFRHFTATDKTTTFILEALRKLELRVRQLEAEASARDALRYRDQKKK